jgi:GT2 family glycosyltransferase
VTGALQFIRWETLDRVGVYDETFKMGWEDVDYCIRAWKAGLSCVYQPGIRAIHHESAFRGNAAPGSKLANWQAASWQRFVTKYARTNFAEFIPNLV